MKFEIKTAKCSDYLIKPHNNELDTSKFKESSGNGGGVGGVRRKQDSLNKKQQNELMSVNKLRDLRW